jgi:ABC-type glycerol-3-phosphate transport system permease component
MTGAWAQTLMGFFKGIPRDLEDAAMIDGLSRFGAFIKVVMPISVAGMPTAANAGILSMASRLSLRRRAIR